MTTLDDRPAAPAPEYPPLPRMVKPPTPEIVLPVSQVPAIDPSLIAPSPRPDPPDPAWAIAEARQLARVKRTLEEVAALAPMVSVEHDGVVYTSNDPQELLRLLAFGPYGSDYCYCSPSRRMVFDHSTGRPVARHRVRVAAYFAAWAIAAILFVLLF